MPSLIPAAVSAIGAAIGGTFGATLIMYSTQIAAGLVLAGGLAYSASARRKAERAARAQYNAAQVDRIANVPGTIAPRTLVLGRARVGGHVFFRGSVGENKEKFVMALAIAGHEIDGIEQYWLNDVAVTLDGDGWVQTEPYSIPRRESRMVAGTEAPPEAIPGTAFVSYGGVDGGDPFTTYQVEVFDSKARIRTYLGTADQSADAQLRSDFPDLWTADHRARGVAYLVVEFFYDETAFPSGLPNVSATIRGARCFDPRTGLTAWTENPAILQRHVLTHPQFGKRSSISAAEDARIIAAANACDITHDYGEGAVPMFRSSLVVPFGTQARDVLDDLAQAMGGQWAYAQGQFFTRAGVYTAPVMSLTEADLATVQRDAEGAVSQQPISISPHAARADRINVVAPRIWDAAQDYKQVPLDPVKATALIEADGVELVQEVDMQGVFYAQQAQHIAGMLMRDLRDPLTVRAAFKLSAYPLELFDTVTLTVPRYGWTDKVFMVMARSWTLGGAIELTLKETAAAIYQPDASFVASGYAQNTALPRPWDISPPSSLLATSGTSELIRQADGTIITRVRVSWTPITDVTLLDAGTVEVQWSLAATDTLRWSGATVSARESQVFLTGAPDNSAIIIRARTRNAVAVSDWTSHLPHTVVGKTEPPPAFDVFQVLAQPDGTRQFNFAYTTTQRPADWLGAEIAYLTGTHTTPAWSSMLPLQNDQTHYTASPVEVNQLLSGPHTFACRSVDTTGNASAPLYFQIDLPPRRLGDVVAEYDEPSENWPGTLSGCERDPTTNVLWATSTTTWDSLTTWDAWTRWSMTSTSPITYTTPVRDFGASITVLVDVVAVGLGTLTVELRSSQTSSDPVADPSEWTAWGAADSRIDARYIQIRVTATATGGDPVASISGLSYVVSAKLVNEYINDVDISTLTGSYRIGTGDIRVPLENTYTYILELFIVIQDTTAGAWTWVLMDKSLSPSPRVQFRLNGTLADPQLVDFVVKGF